MLTNKLETAEDKIRGTILLGVTFFIAFTITTWFQIAFAEDKKLETIQPNQIEEIIPEEEVEGDYVPKEDEMPAVCFEEKYEYFCYRT